MAQHCGLEEACRDRGRVCTQRLSAVYRRKTPNYELGRPAERRKEIPTEVVADDLVLLGSREKGNHGFRFPSLRVWRFRLEISIQIAIEPVELPVEALDQVLGLSGARQIVVLPWEDHQL